MPNLYQVVQTDFKPECYDENFDTSSYLFTDYESFRVFIDKGEWELGKYIDIVDEKYFESKNLVVAVVSLADGGDGLRISYPIENGNTLQFKCYAVSQPCIAPDIECEEAVFIETSKKIEKIELERGDRISIPFMLDGSNPMIYN